MSPKIVDPVGRGKHIIEAAIPLIGHRGIAQTRMEDIAEAADIGKGTIYEYLNPKKKFSRPVSISL